MNVVRISANNVRVVFSDAELKKYGLEINGTEGELCAPRGTVKRILEAVKSESGVDYCGERVFVRLVRMRDGGCDVMISRLGVSEREADVAAAVRFPSVGALIAACRTMDKRIRADAYFGIGGAYLLIKEGDASAYGETVNFPYAEAFVREHCRLVAEENAVSALGIL